MNINGDRKCMLISAMNDGVIEFQVNETRYIYRVPPVYVKRILKLSMKSDFKALNLVKRSGKLIKQSEVEE